MLSDNFRTCASKQGPKHDCDDDCVVERAYNWDEVRNEIERHRQVADQQCKQDLVPARNAGILHEAREEDRAVRYEACPRSRIGPSSDKEQCENEGDVDRKRDSKGSADPAPCAHGQTVCRRLARPLRICGDSLGFGVAELVLKRAGRPRSRGPQPVDAVWSNASGPSTETT
jgi:hypothetical protein